MTSIDMIFYNSYDWLAYFQEALEVSLQLVSNQGTQRPDVASKVVELATPMHYLSVQDSHHFGSHELCSADLGSATTFPALPLVFGLQVSSVYSRYSSYGYGMIVLADSWGIVRDRYCSNKAPKPRDEGIHRRNIVHWAIWEAWLDVADLAANVALRSLDRRNTYVKTKALYYKHLRAGEEVSPTQHSQ